MPNRFVTEDSGADELSGLNLLVDNTLGREKMKYLKLTGLSFWITCLIGTFATVTAVQAQQGGAGATEGGLLEEIIVTTRKREETLLDIPVSITAWGADELDRSGAIGLQDFSVRTPGFSYHDQAGQIPGRYNTALRFRGMDTNQSAPSQQIGTAFMDGVYIPTGVGSIGFENIERIEIIRGPQSAVFGRSTFAGAVNYVTRKPGNELGGRVRAMLAQDQTYDLSMSVEGPIVKDKLAYRVTARGYGTGGQYDSATDGGALGEEETYALQGELAWTPTSSLALRFRTFYSEDSDGAPNGIFLGGAASNRGKGPNLHNCFSDGITDDDGIITDFFCGEVPEVDTDRFTRSNTTLDPFLVKQFTSD
ncbi:MAG: TonB-dependent receptor plug domain-containing protein, partial [Gammaproteobacteria bacterium]|nr:TonB-dependent receptor plug domain-containing protein [Gammaproteobacteria bacterium]